MVVEPKKQEIIYNSIDDLSLEHLTCSILSIINLYLADNEKIKKIPSFDIPNKTTNEKSTKIELIIETEINGDFNGWDGETIFKLRNGQIWQQAEYDYMYDYDYSPKVKIFKTVNGYIMKVEGVDEKIKVIRIK